MRERYNAFYVFNIVFQSIFTLLWHIGAAILAGWLLVNKLGVRDWIYVPIILIGVVTGLISMVRFIIAGMNALDNLEKQRRMKQKKAKTIRKEIQDEQQK